MLRGGLPCSLRLGFALLLTGLLLVATPCAAEQRLRWQPGWRRVGIPEYVGMPSLFLGHFATRYLLPPVAEPLWTRPLLFDRQVRASLGLESRGGRQLAGDISDWVALASLSQPLLIDSALVAGLGDDNPDVAWQLGVISLQSFALTTFLNTVSKRAFARQRPYGAGCADDPSYSSDCESGDRFRSFYSGHAAITATSAGLVCAHHTHLPLYGGGIYDAAACIGALLGTITTGTLRVVADKHWATDVVVGHVVGLASGFVVPSLFYYRSFQARPEAAAATSAAPVLFSWGGQF